MWVYVICPFTRGLPSRSRIVPETVPPCGIIVINTAATHSVLIIVPPEDTRTPSSSDTIQQIKVPRSHGVNSKAESRRTGCFRRFRFVGSRRPAALIESLPRRRSYGTQTAELCQSREVG